MTPRLVWATYHYAHCRDPTTTGSNSGSEGVCRGCGARRRILELGEEVQQP